MAKTITITISDEHVDAIERFLRPQLKQKQDPDTGLVTTEPVYPGGIAQYLTAQLTQLIHGIARTYPSPALLKKLKEIRQLEKEVEDMAKPDVTVA
jgi:hypothetical protein